MLGVQPSLARVASLVSVARLYRCARHPVYASSTFGRSCASTERPTIAPHGVTDQVVDLLRHSPDNPVFFPFGPCCAYAEVMLRVGPGDAHQGSIACVMCHRVVPLVHTLLQALRDLPKPLQSWKPNCTTLASEVALEFVDYEAAVISFPRQDTKGDQTAGDVVHLRALGARLTAR
jgi:hypothetical protein